MDFEQVNERVQHISRRLNEVRVVCAGTLRSHIPVVGPLVTWVRRLWNRVVSQWYVDPVVDGVRWSG